MAKKATTILAEAQQELLDTNAKLSDSGRRRDQLLLAGDERGLDAIETELAGLQKAAVRQADRIRLLEEQARQEEAAAVVKRRADLIVRFEKKLAESDREADELQNLLAQAEKKFRRIIELRTDARAAWPIGDSHANAVAGTAEGAALSGAAVKRLLSWHLYRIGARPFLGGRPGEIKEEDFPGAACPRNEVRGRPLDITPFADALRAASKFAVDMMKGKLDPLAALPPAAVVPPAASTTDETAPPGPVRSDQQERLAELLKEQARLAEDMTPASEEMYRAVVAQIAAEQQIMPDTPAAAPADLTAEQIYAMTPEQAGAALAAMDRALHPPPSVVPQDAQDARATLDLLSRDASFARELFSGSIEARKRFDELVAKSAAGDDVGDAIAGIVEPALPLIETTAEGELPRRAVEATIAGMREDGMNDASIEQAVNLPPISRAEHAAATALWNMRSGTAEWVKRLTSGDYQAKLEWRNLTTLLSSPIAEE